MLKNLKNAEAMKKLAEKAVKRNLRANQPILEKKIANQILELADKGETTTTFIFYKYNDFHNQVYMFDVSGEKNPRLVAEVFVKQLMEELTNKKFYVNESKTDAGHRLFNVSWY